MFQNFSRHFAQALIVFVDNDMRFLVRSSPSIVDIVIGLIRCRCYKIRPWYYRFDRFSNTDSSTAVVRLSGIIPLSTLFRSVVNRMIKFHILRVTDYLTSLNIRSTDILCPVLDKYLYDKDSSVNSSLHWSFLADPIVSNRNSLTKCEYIRHHQQIYPMQVIEQKFLFKDTAVKYIIVQEHIRTSATFDNHRLIPEMQRCRNIDKKHNYIVNIGLNLE